jgi:hypothetical protein
LECLVSVAMVPGAALFLSLFLISPSSLAGRDCEYGGDAVALYVVDLWGAIRWPSGPQGTDDGLYYLAMWRQSFSSSTSSGSGRSCIRFVKLASFISSLG